MGSNGSDRSGAVYTPRQFAMIVGRSVSTLKNWERKGYLRPGRYPSGQRYYTQEHVDQILGESSDCPDPDDVSSTDAPSTANLQE